MISTTHLTAAQLEQLEALLADTTPGGGPYRPPVVRDVEVLQDLECMGLAVYVEDVSYENYAATDAGRAVVVGRAQELAESEAFLMYASDDELRAAIAALKVEAARYLDSDGNGHLRERVLLDIEACQDALDNSVESPMEELTAASGHRSESTGRHHVVPADDRPTTVLPSVGTLPGLPIVEPHPDQESAERLIAAIKGADTGQDIYDELLAETTGEWAELEAELADESSWWQRTVADRLTPRRTLVLAVVTAVVLTWFVAWLVMG